MKFWSSDDDAGSRIENKLKTINLSSWKVEQKRVAVADFGVNERSSNSTSSSAINRSTFTSEITDIEKA